MFVHKIGQACQGLEDLVFSHPSFHPLEFPLCHGSDSAPICWNFDIFSDYVINYSPNSRWPVPFTLCSQWAKKNPEKLEVPNHLTDPWRNLIQEIHYRVYRACKRNIYWEIGNCELIISQLNLWNSCLLIGNFGIVLSTTASPGACTGFKRPPAWVEPTEIFFELELRKDMLHFDKKIAWPTKNQSSAARLEPRRRNLARSMLHAWNTWWKGNEWWVLQNWFRSWTESLILSLKKLNHWFLVFESKLFGLFHASGQHLPSISPEHPSTKCRCGLHQNYGEEMQARELKPFFVNIQNPPLFSRELHDVILHILWFPSCRAPLRCLWTISDSRRQSNWIRIRKKTEKGWHQEPFFCRCSHLNMKSSGKQTHCKLRAEVSYK